MWAIDSELPVYLRKKLDPRRIDAVGKIHSSPGINFDHLFDKGFRLAWNWLPKGVVKLKPSFAYLLQDLLVIIASEGKVSTE